MNPMELLVDPVKVDGLVRRFNPEQLRGPDGKWISGLGGFENEHPTPLRSENLNEPAKPDVAELQDVQLGRPETQAEIEAAVTRRLGELRAQHQTGIPATTKGFNPFEHRNARGEWTNGELAGHVREQAKTASSHLQRKLLEASADVIEHGKGAHADHLRDLAREQLGPKPGVDRHGGATVENLTGNFAF